MFGLSSVYHQRPIPSSLVIKFYNRIQGQAEPVEQFITELKLLAKDCAFQDPEHMICDRLVLGTNSQKIRERLINKGSELTLDKASNIMRNYKLAKDQLKSMTKDDETIHAIGRQRRTPSNKGRYPRRNSRLKERDEENQRSRESREQRCQNCGGDAHKRGDQCPTKGKACHKCKKLNHFTRVCRSTRVDHIVEEEDEYSSEEDHPTDLFIRAISSKMQKSTPVPDES